MVNEQAGNFYLMPGIIHFQGEQFDVSPQCQYDIETQAGGLENGLPWALLGIAFIEVIVYSFQ